MANKQVYKPPRIDIIHQDIEYHLLGSSVANGSGVIHTGDGGIGEEEQLSKEFSLDNDFASEDASTSITLTNPNLWEKWDDDNID